MKRSPATIKDFGWGWRYQNGVIEKKDKREVEFYSLSVPDFISLVQRNAESLSEATVEMDVDYGSYGDRDRDKLYVEGWRAATDEEISEKRQEVAKIAEARRTYLSNAERELRAARPELFKD